MTLQEAHDLAELLPRGAALTVSQASYDALHAELMGNIGRFRKWHAHATGRPCVPKCDALNGGGTLAVMTSHGQVTILPTTRDGLC